MPLRRATLAWISILAVCLWAAAGAVGQASAHHRPGHGTPPTATPEPTATPVPCSGCPSIHIGAVHAGGGEIQGGTEGICRVIINDAAGNQIAGATVDIAWTGAYEGTDSGITTPFTDPVGPTQALFRVETSKRCKGKNPSVIFTCSVTGVFHPDYTYVPGNNVQDTDSDDACTFP